MKTRANAMRLSGALALQALLAACGGGGGSGSDSGGSPIEVENVCQPALVLPAGTRIEVVMAITPGGTELASTMTAIGEATFQGHAVQQFDVSFSTAGLSSTVSGFGTYDPAAGIASGYGAKTHSQSNDGRMVQDMLAVATPPTEDRRYALEPGQSFTATATTDVTVSTTVDGVKQPTRRGTETTTTTVRFAGAETVTVPAGTFNACKYVETIDSRETTRWEMAGYGVTVKSVSAGVTTIAKSIEVNGSALRHFP